MRSRLTVLPFVAAAALASMPAAWGATDNAHIKTLLEEGNLTQAIDELRQATTADPKDADAWGWLSEAYLRSTKFDSAQVAAHTLVDLKDDWGLSYALLGRSQLALGDVAGAKSTVEKGLKKSQKRIAQKKESGAAIYTAHGLVLLAADSTDQAVIELTKAKDEDPSNALAVEALGDAYFKRGIPALAVTQYETAVQMDSTDATRNYKLAQAYLKDKRYNEAARAYERSIKLNPDNSAAILDLARIYVASKHYKEATPILGTYVQRTPDSKEGWTLYMEALDHTNLHEDLERAARKVMELDPGSHEAMRALAHAQAELKRPDEAIRTYQQLAAVDSLTMEDYRLLGKSYAQNKQDTLAVANLEKALGAADVSPVDASEIAYELGVSYMRMAGKESDQALRAQRYQRAADYFQKRIMADTTATAAAAYLNYGLSNMYLKRYDLAGPAFLRVTALKPDLPIGYSYLAKYYGQVDSSRAAIATYQKVISVVGAMPDSAQAQYQKDLAEAWSQIGFTHLTAKPRRLEEALDALTRSIKIKDDDPQTRLWRAQTYALLNRREEAMAEYRSVIRLDADNKLGLKAQAEKDLELFQKKP